MCETHDWRSVSRVLSFFVLIIAPPASLAPGLALAQTTHQATLNRPYKMTAKIDQDSRTTSPLVFSHGYFIDFAHYSNSRGVPNVFIADPSGAMEHELSVWPDQAKSVTITSLDISAARRIAVGGRIDNSDGSRTNFLALSELEAREATYINTDSYLVARVAIADDGSVWTFGEKHSFGASGNANGAGTAKIANYFTVRHYSADGILLERYVPRRDVGGPNPATDSDITGVGQTAFKARAPRNMLVVSIGDQGVDTLRSAPDIFLKTAGNIVVLYNGRDGKLFTYDYAHHTSSTVPLEQDDYLSTHISELAVSASGVIYGSVAGKEYNRTTSGLYRLNCIATENRVEWQPVIDHSSSEPTINGFLSLLGSDREDLIFRSLGSDTINWGRVEK